MSANGDLTTLFQGPIVLTIYAVLVVVLAVAVRNRVVARRAAARTPERESVDAS